MWKKYQGPGKVIVQNGIDIREKMIGSEKGAYFAGQNQEYDTSLVQQNGAGNWRISLQDLEAGEVWQTCFRTQLIIGRSPGSVGEFRVVLKGDLRVSKNHCMIYETQVGLCIRDLGSKNATYVNGERLRQTTVLRNRDILGIGNRKLRVEYGRR